MQDSIPLLTDIIEPGDPDKKEIARDTNPAQDELRSDLAEQETDSLDPLFSTDDEDESNEKLLSTLEERVEQAIEAAMPAIKAQLKRELLSQLSKE